eukprot:g1453.t1
MPLFWRKKKAEGKTTSRREDDEVKALSSKLKEGVLEDVDAIKHYPVLSPMWFRLVDVLERLANIVDVESEMRCDEEEGKTNIWKSEEKVMRLLITRKKTNLLLRLLQDLKAWQYASFSKDDTGETASKTKAVTSSDKDPAPIVPPRCEAGAPPEDFEKKMLRFEIDAGTILGIAWSRIEATQITDRILLVEHCSEVLRGALKYPDLCSRKEFPETQESRCMKYLRDLFVHMSNDAFDSKSVMSFVAKSCLVERLVMFANVNSKYMNEASKLYVCESLASLMDTDEFSAKKKLYVPVSLRTELVGLDESVLAGVLKSDRDRRHRLRPLITQIKRTKISLAK